MDKAQEMAKTSAVGSVQVFFGTSISTVITAVATILLGWFILPGDYGLYVIALVPATTISLFQDWGVGSAIVRYCAKYRSTKEELEQRKVIVAGLTFEFVTGLVLTLVSILIANFISSAIFNKPESALLITLASFTILSGSISTAISSVFTGFEKMVLNSYANIIRAIVYCVLVPLLVYFGYGAVGAIIGFTLGSVVQAALLMVFVYFFIFRKLSSYKINKSEVFQTTRQLLKYGIPLAMGNIVGGLQSSFYSFIMASYVSAALIGTYKIGNNFTILLTFLTIPITTVLFPAFSKIDPRTEKDFLKTVFVSSVKYTVLLLVPATLAMLVLAQPLIGTLYGNKWLDAPIFLILGTLYNLYALFGWKSMGIILPALGENKLVLEINLITLFVAVPMAFLLIPQFGLIIFLIGSQFTGAPGTILGLYLLWKRYGVKADFLSSGKILFASVLASVTVFLFLNFFKAPNWVLLSSGTILFLLVYLISAPLVGAVNQTELDNLRAMFSGMGLISKILEIPLGIMNKILKIRRQSTIQDKSTN
jgi:O-antigen/teichoic acid export membrane protein